MFTIAGYLIILLLLFVHDWHIETYPAPRPRRCRQRAFKFSRHQKYAVKALQHYSRLQEHEKAALKKKVGTCLISIGQWCAHVRQYKPQRSIHCRKFLGGIPTGITSHHFVRSLSLLNRPELAFPQPFGSGVPGLRTNMFNVCALGEHQHGAIEAFLYFMDEIGLQKKDFAVRETRHLPAQITEWFPLLHHQILIKYTSLFVFRNVLHTQEYTPANYRIHQPVRPNP